MRNKNKGLLILVAILFLIVVILSGFIVFDQFIVEENVNNFDNKDNNAKITNNNYQIFAENLESQFSKFDSNNKRYQYINNGAVKDGYVIYLNEKGGLFVKYLDNDLNAKFGEFKLADNVLNFYAINVGQDAGNILYFVNQDGTVGSADLEYGIGNNNQITIEKDIGYKNIVSIVNGTFGDGNSGVHGPIFIDINGNAFSENLK